MVGNVGHAAPRSEWLLIESLHQSLTTVPLSSLSASSICLSFFRAIFRAFTGADECGGLGNGDVSVSCHKTGNNATSAVLWTTFSECYPPGTYLLGMGCQSCCWGGGLACATHDRTERTSCASQVMIYGLETTGSQHMENKHRVDVGEALDYF